MLGNPCRAGRKAGPVVLITREAVSVIDLDEYIVAREIGGPAWPPTLRLVPGIMSLEKRSLLDRWPRSLSGRPARAGHHRVEESEHVVGLRFEDVASLIGERDPGLFASSPKMGGWTQPRNVVQGSGANVAK
jgi:hypothetical protein